MKIAKNPQDVKDLAEVLYIECRETVGNLSIAKMALQQQGLAPDVQKFLENCLEIARKRGFLG